MVLETGPVGKLITVHGTQVPEGVKYREIIVTGPPCSGKTTLVEALRGWSEEGYVDVARPRWWHDRVFTFRPREVHLGLPFVGFDESLAVFDADYLRALPPLAEDRILVPPARSWRFGADWRRRFVFDFQLPDPDVLYALRVARGRRGSHPVDEHTTLDRVTRQVEVYAQTARVFHAQGMRVYVRRELGGPPLRITESPAPQ